MCHEDTVLIEQCRPLSKRKHFALARVIRSPENERVRARQRMEARAQQLLQERGGDVTPQELAAARAGTLPPPPAPPLREAAPHQA
jgi:hypothetical protein